MISQIDADQLANLLADNQGIAQMLRAKGKKDEADAAATDLEAVRYMLWLDANRCSLFFAERVLLVEGISDRAVIEYLTGIGTIAASPLCYVCDSLGKWNMPRFMNLLGALGVPHSVLYDDDGGKHPEKAELIRSSRNEFTGGIECFPVDLEDALGLQVSDRRKGDEHLLALRQGVVDQDKLAVFAAKVQPLMAI